MKFRDFLYILAVLICGTALSSGFLINPYTYAAGGGGGGPGLVASDNFDSYANNADLDAQANWAAVFDFPYILKPGADGAVVGANFSMCRHIGTFSANQRCEITLDGTKTAGEFISAGVRCQSGADTRYWFQADGTDWYLVVRVAGSQTVLATGARSISLGDKIALEVTGASTAARLTAQVYTGGSWSNVTGAVSIDPGAGKYIDGGSPGVGSSSVSAKADDFFGYNL